jgi:glycerol-3-phosphate dehydrogenase
MVEYDVDLFVIGGGSRGVRAARIAAGNDGSQCTAAASNRA